MAQPTLGILTHAIRTHEPSELCGPLTLHIRDLVEHARALGWLAYVFSPRDLLKQRGVVWGWTRSDGAWKRDFFPIPDVTYLRSLAWFEDDAAVIRWLKDETATQFMNNPDIEEIVHDRWRIIQIGLSHPTLHERFLDTSLLRAGTDLGTILADNVRTSVSNRFRSQSHRYGIVSRKADEFVVRTVAQQTAQTTSFHSVDDVQHQLVEEFRDGIVQPYIEPIRVEGCPVQIRSYWQRYRTLRWEETCCMIRIGTARSLVGPLTTAGLFEQFLPLLTESLGEKSDAIRYQIQSVARSVVELFDHRAHGASELAVDLLPVSDARMYIVDVSTLGGIDSLRRISQPALRQQMISNAMSYASALYEQQTVLSEPIPALPQTD